MPSEKIVLGLALYGRTFTLSDPNKNGLGDPTTEPGEVGTYTGEDGFWSSYEICTMGLTVVEDNQVEAPYGYLDDQWVGYDDQTSLLLKVSTLIEEKNLLGAMFWALDLDDFQGTFCGEGRYRIPEVTLLSIHQELLIALLALGVYEVNIVISWKNTETNTSYRKL